jgi:hypothetical protein
MKQGTRAGAILALTMTAGTLGATGTAHAADCGTPAVDAVYKTTTNPAVPATFATEVEWTRTVEDAAAYTEYEWVRKVIDVAYQPAVEEVSHTEYRWPVLTRQDQYSWAMQTRTYTPAGTTTIHHDEVGHWAQGPLLEAAPDEEDVDVPEHVVHHPAVTHVVHHDAVTHVETVIDPNDAKPYAYVKVKNPNYNSPRYEAAGWNGGDSDGDQGWTRYPAADKTVKVMVVDKEAWDETVVDQAAWDETVPATYKTVHHPAVYGPDVWVVDVAAHDEEVPVPESYGEWTDAGFTEWGSTPTAPADTDTARYGAMQHGYTDWQETDTTEWQESDEAPAPTDYVKYGAAQTKTVLDVPAKDEVPEVSHDEFDWTTDDSTAPEGEGWSLTTKRVEHEAVTHTETAWTDEAASPEGEGWARTGKTRQGAQLTAGSPETTVQVLVSPAVPAGPACADASANGDGGDSGDGGAGDPADANGDARPTTVASAVPANLAFTGADTGNAVALGVFLVGGGLALTVAGRRLVGRKEQPSA